MLSGQRAQRVLSAERMDALSQRRACFGPVSRPEDSASSGQFTKPFRLYLEIFYISTDAQSRLDTCVWGTTLAEP